MEDFEVHFNTAATRLYGLRILKVLREAVLAKKGGEENQDAAWLTEVNLTFDANRLITRDDKAKYAVQGELGDKTEI